MGQGTDGAGIYLVNPLPPNQFTVYGPNRQHVTREWVVTSATYSNSRCEAQKVEEGACEAYSAPMSMGSETPSRA
jgi:hypothetical protein